MWVNFKLNIQFVVILSAPVFVLAACSASVLPVPTLTPSPTFEPNATSAPTATPRPTPTPFPEIDLDLNLPEGVAERGDEIARVYQCRACHDLPEWGPVFQSTEEMPGMLERGEIRIASPNYSGRATTSQEYIIESILLPEIYIVPGNWFKPMSQYHLDMITEQELADLIAWITSLE